MIENNDEKLIRLQKLNQELIDLLSDIAIKLIRYAKENNMRVPYEIEPLFISAQNLINEINNPTSISKKCNVCNRLNPDNGKYCSYCGSSLLISQVSPDLLQSKNREDFTRNDTEPLQDSF